MKKKMLIISIVAALLMLSVPFVSSIQATTRQAVVLEKDSSISLDSSTKSIDEKIDEKVVDVQATLLSIKKDFAFDSEVVATCDSAIAQANAILIGGDFFCDSLMLLIMGTVGLANLLYYSGVPLAIKMAFRLIDNVDDLMDLYEKHCM